MVTSSRTFKPGVDAGGEHGRRRRPPASANATVRSAPVIHLPRQQGPEDGVVLTPEQSRSRRARSIAIALVLAALAMLFYAVTIVKLGPGVLDRPL